MLWSSWLLLVLLAPGLMTGPETAQALQCHQLLVCGHGSDSRDAYAFLSACALHCCERGITKNWRRKSEQAVSAM